MDAICQQCGKRQDVGADGSMKDCLERCCGAWPRVEEPDGSLFWLITMIIILIMVML